MRTRTRNFCVALVALALFLGVEVSLRVLTNQDSKWNLRLGAGKIFDPVSHYRNKPNYAFEPGIVTNEHGFFAPPGVSFENPPDALRLLYMGDSNSVMPCHAQFPALAESLLERRLGIEVVTINTAVPGYSSENARLLFLSEVFRYEADYFLVYLGWNDLSQFGPEGLSYKLHDSGYPISTFQRILSQIYSLRFLLAKIQLQQRKGPTADEPLIPEEESLYAGYTPTHFIDNLSAILEKAQTIYPRIYLMTLATLTSTQPTEEEMRRMHFPIGMGKNVRKLHRLVESYNAAVWQVARTYGVPVIDLYGFFDSPEARASFTDSCHMTRAGTRLIAEHIASEIARREAEAPSTR